MSIRWIVALAGTAMHLCLGTVYAWSYFQQPVMALHHWSNSQVAWTFSLAICSLGLAAAGGGMLLPRFGAQRLALVGGRLVVMGFGLGALVTSKLLAPPLLVPCAGDLARAAGAGIALLGAGVCGA